MSDEVTVSFAGPFSWAGAPDAPCVHDTDVARKSGIYLWTVPLPQGHLIYYVGETERRFEIRLREHYEQLAAARYHVYSAAEFAVAKSYVCGRAATMPLTRRPMMIAQLYCPVSPNRFWR